MRADLCEIVHAYVKTDMLQKWPRYVIQKSVASTMSRVLNLAIDVVVSGQGVLMEAAGEISHWLGLGDQTEMWVP